MRSFNKSTKGVTLIELMLVIAIMGIVLGFIYSIFISQMRMSTWRAQLADRQQNCQAAMNVLIGDLMKAKSINYVDGFGTELCDDVISLKIGSETITYSTDGTTENPAALRRVSSVAGRSADIADNVTGLAVQCFDRVGQTMLRGSVTDALRAADVRRAQISLSCITSGFRPGSDVRSETTLTSSVEFRNMPNVSGSGCGILSFGLSPTNVAFCDAPPDPGGTSIIEVEICTLAGEAKGGTVKIYPKVPILDIQSGTATITLVDGVAEMEIPTPAEGAKCADMSPYTALVAAADMSKMLAGTTVEMVAVWMPEGTGCADIITSRGLTIAAAAPYMFEDEVITISSAVMSACSGEEADLTVTVTDNCGNPISGEIVTFSIVGDPEDDTWGVLDPPLIATDNGDGTYSTIYNAGTLATTITIQAEDTDIVNPDNQTITGTITINPNSPDNLLLTTGGTIALNECPNNESRIEFRVQDKCTPPNMIVVDQLSELSVSTTSSGSVQNAAADGNAYFTIYNTPASCGPGGDFTIGIDHDGIGDGDDLTIQLDLGQCPSPGLNLDATFNELAAGCSDVTLQFTATIWKNDCTPDAQPAWITFEVRNQTSPAGYGVTDPRNARFETGAIDLVRQVVSTDTGIATVELMAHDSLPGDLIRVRAIANVVAYGGATYTSDEYQVTIITSATEGKFYEDDTFTTEATFYDVPAKVPDEEVGTIFIEVRDCDENEDIDIKETVNVTLESDDAVGIINTTTAILAETDANSGIFRVIVPIKRSAAPGTMEVDKGGFITSSYVDNDDPGDTFSKTIPLTGCRQLRIVNATGNDIATVEADPFPYDPAFPEGDNTFRMILNSPAFAGNVIRDTGTVHICAGTGDEDTVTLREEAADNGIFKIDGPSLGPTHTRDYIYVGEDLVNNPLPGGDADIGLRIDSTPDIITIVFPRGVGIACNTSDQDVQNYGCWTTVGAIDIDNPTVTLTPPGSPLTGTGSFTIDADDGMGTISTVTLKLRCISDSCTLTTNSYTPGTPTFWVSDSFDSSLYPDGDYVIYAVATDSEGNTGTSAEYTLTVQNTCTISITATRNAGDTVTVSGKYLLNGSSSPVQISIGIPSLAVPVEDTTFSDNDGVYSWPSSGSYPVVPTGVQVRGAHGKCTASNSATW